jgi:hypothetical protein
METETVVRVTTYLAPEERRALRQLALDTDTTVTEIVRRLIQAELNK